MSAPAKKANPMVTPNKAGLTKKDYQAAISTLCTGCGHDSISMHIVSAFYDLNIAPHEVAKFSGIGCSSKTPTYFLGGSFGFNSVHGRMPSVATGAHIVNRDMINIAVSGDGDTASIGVGQFVHAIRRNIPLIYICENNGVYGLTKGQFSATAEKNSILKRGEKNVFQSIDLCMMAIDLGCDFVGRSFSGDIKQCLPMIKAGISHSRQGLAFLDIISPCITFNNHEGSTKSYPYVKEHEEWIHEVGFVPNAREIKVDYPEGEAKAIELHDGSMITLKKMERDYDPTDRAAALQLLEEAKKKGQILTGLFYVNPETKPLAEELGLVEKPLIGLEIDELRPGKEELNQVMQSLM